jgi:hypothetical protein
VGGIADAITGKNDFVPKQGEIVVGRNGCEEILV